MSHNSSKEIKAGAFLGYANFAVKMIIQLVYVPILLRLLGQAEYGVYQLIASVISYLSLLNFGFGGSYLRFYSQCKGDKKKEDNLNGSYFIVFCVFAIIAFIAGIVLTVNTKFILGSKLTADELDLAKKLMFIMTINMAISFPISVFSSIVTSRECFIFQKIVELLKSICNPVLVIFVLLLGYGSIGLILVSTVLTLIAAAINIWYVIFRINAGFDFQNFNMKLMKEVSAFSFFIFLNSIIDQINWNVDKFLLGRFVGSISIALYSVGAQINNIYIQITDMLATVVAPRVNIIAVNEKNPLPKLSALWIKVGRMQAMMVLAIISGFAIFGKQFIILWAGQEYSSAYYIALLLILPVSIPLCQTLGVDIQRALNKHQYRSIVYAAVAIANLLISIPLVKKYGAIGAALGTAIALLIGNVLIMNIIYKKIIRLDVLGFWKSILTLVPSVVPSIICTVVYKRIVIIDRWSTLLIGCILFMVVYTTSLYLFGIKQEEKEMFSSIMKKIMYHHFRSK